MKSLHPKYDREPELHDLYERLLSRFRDDPDSNLFPKIDHIEAFLSLFRLQGKLWCDLYEADPWQMIRFIFGGSEKAFGMKEFSKKQSKDSFKDLIENLGLALARPEKINTELIPNNLALNAVPIVLANRCFQICFVCMMHHKIPIQAIIEAARKGNRTAFLALVAMDSVFLFSDFGQMYLIEAELRNDLEMKDKLADALTYNPKLWTLKGKFGHYAFLMLWMLDDFAYRTDKQWAEFFADHGFDSWADPGNVRKNRERYNLPKLRRKSK